MTRSKNLPVTEKNSKFENDPTSEYASEASALPLAQQVAARLRDMIIQDQLVPGEWIREQAIADKLRVSRTPLREALKMLELEGLIKLLPNRGAVVTELTVDEVKEKLEVLAVLESLAGKLACRNATDSELAEIRALHYEMRACFSRKNRPSMHRAGIEQPRAPCISRIHPAGVAAGR